jgi:hypothetical protein
MAGIPRNRLTTLLTSKERTMRVTLSTAALLALLVAPAAGQQQKPAPSDDSDRAVQGGGTLPAGWSVRPDGKGDRANVKVVTMGTGLHVTLGPAIILYRAANVGTGPMHTLATFTQTKRLEHAEGYGLFFGGKTLDGPGQSYTYFLVRQDGSYLIKRRAGEKTTDVTKGWVPSPAVKKPDAKGSSTNLLEIDAKEEPSKVRFLVNGQTVFTADAKDMPVDGAVGLRVNHNLDLHIEGFDVHR